MKNLTKKTFVSTKKFVYKHKIAIAFVAGATAGLAINRRSIRDWNAFLEERGLTAEYYTPEG